MLIGACALIRTNKVILSNIFINKTYILENILQFLQIVKFLIQSVVFLCSHLNIVAKDDRLCYKTVGGNFLRERKTIISKLNKHSSSTSGKHVPVIFTPLYPIFI